MTTGWETRYDLSPVAMPSRVQVQDYPPHAFNHKYQVDTYAIRAQTLHQASLDIQALLMMDGARILNLVARPELESALRALTEDIVRQPSAMVKRAIVWVPSRGPTYYTKNGFPVYWVAQPRKRHETVDEYLARCNGIHDPRRNHVVTVTSADDVTTLSTLAADARGLPTLEPADPSLWRTLWSMNPRQSTELVAVHTTGPPRPYPVVPAPQTLVLSTPPDRLADMWRFFPNKWDWIQKQALAAANPGTPTRKAALAARNVDAWVRGCVPEWIYAHPEPGMRQRLLFLGRTPPTTLWQPIRPNTEKTGPDKDAADAALANSTRFFVVVKTGGRYELQPIFFAVSELGWKNTKLHTIHREGNIKMEGSTVFQFALTLCLAEAQALQPAVSTDGKLSEDDSTLDAAATKLEDAYNQFNTEYEALINTLIANTHAAIEDYPKNLRSIGPIDITRERKESTKEIKDNKYWWEIQPVEVLNKLGVIDALPYAITAGASIAFASTAFSTLLGY